MDHGYSEEYGARNIKRFIKNQIAVVIAQALLERKLPQKKGDLYTPKIIKGEFQLSNIKDRDKLTDSSSVGLATEPSATGETMP